MEALAQTPPSLRLPLRAAGALVLVALMGTAAVRWSGLTIREPDAAVVSQRSLRFLDRPDGSIQVLDAATGVPLDNVVGQAGFVRGTLRALARERRRVGLGAEPAFELVARADNRLTLLDPSTGQRVDLESFGPTNAAAFAQWLQRKDAR